MIFQGINDEEKITEAWIARSNALMSYWKNMESEYLFKLYPTFENLLICEMKRYNLLNEDYYSRFGGLEQIKIANHGGRIFL